MMEMVRLGAKTLGGDGDGGKISEKPFGAISVTNPLLSNFYIINQRRSTH